MAGDAVSWIIDCSESPTVDIIYVGASGTSRRVTATSLARVVCMEINSVKLLHVQIILFLLSPATVKRR